MAIRRPIQNANTHDYLRITVYVAPFIALIPPNNIHNVTTVLGPTDDHHTAFYFIAWNDASKPGVDTDDVAHVQQGDARHRSRRRTSTTSARWTTTTCRTATP